MSRREGQASTDGFKQWDGIHRMKLKAGSFHSPRAGAKPASGKLGLMVIVGMRGQLAGRT